VLVDDPQLLSRPDAGITRAPVDVLGEAFDFERIAGAGGLVDWLVEPPLGATFLGAAGPSRAFLEHALALEERLRASGALAPSRFLARLVPRGQSLAPIEPHGALGASTDLPDLEDAGFAFPARVDVVSHSIAGDDADAPLLGEGFYYFEPDRGIRWTRPTFTLLLPLPPLPHPLPCEVVLECVSSSGNAGGADVLVAGREAARIEDVGELLSRADPRITIRFTTRGGPTEITVALDEPRASSGEGDARELGLVVRRFSAALEWR
jgi:hypothetical protein